MGLPVFIILPNFKYARFYLIRLNRIPLKTFPALVTIKSTDSVCVWLDKLDEPDSAPTLKQIHKPNIKC